MQHDDQSIARRFAALSAPARRAFLDKLRDSGLNFAELPIVPAGRQGPLPLSHGQRSLWLTWQLDPASPAYNMPGALRLKGLLDANALHKSLDDLLARHESLRTVFRADGGEPEQRVLDVVHMCVPASDLRSMPAASRTTEARRLLRVFAEAPFRLDEEAPFRAALFQLADDEHLLALAVHHIAADGWSLRILIDEWVALYTANATGRAAGLAPPTLQFADYAVWQRHWLDAGESERQLDFWRARLGSEHPPLDLPIDHARNATGSSNEGRHAFRLPRETSESLRGLAHGRGASLYMAMLALLKLTLHRFTGQRDLRIGSPIANRSRADTHGLIGYLTNVQVLRTVLDPLKGFGHLLAQVRATVLDAQSHQDLPFDLLVEALQPTRQAGVHPLFQLKCTEQTELPQTTSFAGLEMRIEELSGGRAHFDLSLDFTPTPDGIACVFVYAAALFDDVTIARFAMALECLAGQVSRLPEMALAALELPGPHSGLSGAPLACEGEDVLALWSRSVERRPQGVAVRCEDQTHGFAELDAQAERLADELVAQGVGPDVRVGLHAERSCEFVLGVLAVLKAGGAYVPLDPQLPPDRLAYQLADSGARLLLSTNAPGWTPGVSILKLAFQPDLPAVSLARRLPARLHPQQAAYVIYTSGSTGQPKGVVVTRRALSNYVQGVLERIDLPGDATSLAMVSTVAADLGHTSLFGALCSGRTLHLISAACAFDPDRFSQYMAEHRVDVLKIVPSHLQALLQAANAEDVLPRHALVVGGEATPWPLLERIQALRPGCRVVNHYGPTETTVGVLTQAANAASRQAATLPLGRPLPRCHALVLDAELNLVPPGVAGELYLGGPGVARGYQARAALTAERFVPNPAGEGERLYRTGDRVRMLADGSLEFLGRLDDQVKIRGYRVEPREVRSALLMLAGVREAEVVIGFADDGRAQLLGYAVPRRGAALDADALRRQLAGTLPDYMVPAAIVLLDALPLTPNGKLDRKALPAPRFDTTQDHAAPQGAVEETLARVWAEVLRVERVGRDDNFFELGGDSILTLQIIARARKHGVRVSPKQLMELQTIARVVAAMPQSPAPEAPKLVEAGSGAVPMTPIQRWFFSQPMSERHHWNQSVLLEVDEPVDAVRMRHALQRLVAHHEALGFQFVEEAGQWRQRRRVNVDAGWRFSQVDLSREADAAAAIESAADDAQRSLDLRDGPLLHAVWMNLGHPRPGRLLLVGHHLVVDAVSWRVLLEDLQGLYATGELQAQTSSFRDWSHRLNEHASSEAVRQESAYWASADAPDTGWPIDHPQGRNTAASLRNVRVALDEKRTAQLLTQCSRPYRTRIDELLLSALALCLAEWAGLDSVRIEIEGHGREDLFDGVDLSRTVGWFTTLCPVRLAPQEDVARTIQAVKEQLRQMPGKGLGYGVLRHLGEQGAVAPQPQLSFNYLGQVDQTELAGWRLAGESTGQERSPGSLRRSWFDVIARVQGGCLLVDWGHSANLHEPAVVAALAQRYAEQLRQVIAHCLGSEAGGLTPSDVPLSRLTQAQLDSLALDASVVEDIYPLAPMQQGMLFHSLLDPGDGAYLNQLSIDIEGLDAVRFRAAWQEVFDRHEILRSGFIHRLDDPLQWVSRSARLPFVEHDWRGRDDLPQALVDLARADAALGFDLERPPLMRITLVRTGERGHHLVWTRHHVLMDGWSTSQLLGEVLQHCAGRPAAASAGRYRDYIAWLQARDTQASEAFWRDELQALDEPTSLGDALPVRSPAAGRGECLRTLDAGATHRLAQFAKRERVTVNTLVQAAWALLLQRCTGKKAVAFGATVAGRPAEVPGAERLLGLFINTLPVLAAPRPEQRIGEWLRELQAKNLAAREHEQTPLYEIQRWAGQGGRSLFDSIVVFENYPVADALRETAPAGLRFGPMKVRDETHYAMTLCVESAEVEAKQVLNLQFSFARAQFDEGMVGQLATQIVRTLTALVEDPLRRLGAVDLLSEADRARLSGRGAHGHQYPDDEPVHRLFERRVAQRPGATALTFGDQALSYAELNARANRLAHRLIELGVRPETKVGLAVERSIEMVVGLLAVLKAGGAYVPLDPQYPPQRLAYMIEDSGIELLLTQSRVSLPPTARLTVLDVDTVDAALPRHNPGVELHPDNLAYVIYTSGSTGKPKGALLAHRNVSRLFSSTEAWFKFDGRDVWTLFHSFAFDFSVWEIWGALLHGGRLVVVPQPVARDPAQFHALLRRERVTVLNQTPSAFQQLAQADAGFPPLADLRHVIFGGEALDRDALAPWFARYGHAQPALVNMYGITETTVHVTYLPLAAGDMAAPASVGRAIPDLAAHVLDANLNPAAPGVAGELYVAGAGLARGYLNRHALTAERFVPAPFGGVPGARLYRTGDLARHLPDGGIEYLGRIDYQVKIRGFRIELGEIESLLRGEPGVCQAVVLARPGAGGQRLVAYASGEEGVRLNPAALRERLGTVLPDHMVPSAIVVLPRLPLNHNGKIDRAALPEPELANTANHEPPQGGVETALAAIWTEILGVEPVGRGDNFFELGGHSLLAAQLSSRVRRDLGIDLPLRKVFEHPVLQSLAGHIRSASTEPAQRLNEPVLERIPRAAAMPLSPIQNRLWLADRLAETSGSNDGAAYNMAAALRLTGPLDLEAVRDTLNAVARRHEVLRSAYPENDDGDPIAVISAQAGIELALVDLSMCPIGEQQERLEPAMSAHAGRGFNLATGPLLRAALLRLAPRRHVLLLCAHHIVFDGWSQAVFIGEFVKIYRALKEKATPQLPSLHVQYADFAAWHARRLDGGMRKADADFWRDYLDAAPLVSPLPTDHPRPERVSTAGDSLSLQVAKDVSDALARLAGAHDTTLFTVLLAAFLLVLHRQADADDLVVGTDVAGRNHPDLEGLIGFFVNVVPLRSRLGPDMDFPQWLSRVKDSVLSAFEHQDLPFDQIVEAAGVPRGRQAHPLVQILFVLQNVPEARFDIPGLAIEVIERPATRSKFDLAVFVSETPQGLAAEWVFATSLYRRDTVERVAAAWRDLLAQLVARPGAPLESFAIPHFKEATMNTNQTPGPAPKAGKLDKLKRIAGKGAMPAAAPRPAVRTSFLPGTRHFPIVIEPAGSDLDPIAWARRQRDFVEATLSKHAGILFRNFGLKTPQDFEAFAEAIEPQLYGSYGDLPKKEGGRNTYRSTPYPERQMILFHNESSHLDRWPRKQWFFCELPSPIGGATPIVDGRDMLRRLPPDLVGELERKQLLYVRTFTDRLDVSWQAFFKTESRADVEARLAQAGIEWRWLGHDELQTRTRCPAVITHPVTGERVFFNQMQLHHVSCLEPDVREDLLAMVGLERMPRHVCFGDGTPIPDETMALIGLVYEECAVRFDWRQGDVVMLDNMLAAHARDPYDGPRKIVVAMGAMFDRAALGAAAEPDAAVAGAGAL